MPKPSISTKVPVRAFLSGAASLLGLATVAGRLLPSPQRSRSNLNLAFTAEVPLK